MVVWKAPSSSKWVRSLFHDLDFGLQGPGVMGADLRTIAVFEGRNDPAAVGVVFGVGAGHDVNVQGKADLVSPDLDIPFFHDVEEPHLNLLPQVGKFVDGKNPAIGAGDESVMDGQFIGEVAAFGNLDGVHLPDEVGDGHIRGGQFLSVSLLPAQPDDLCPVPLAS